MELTGRLLGQRYELLSLLAGGGMGQVWRARDTLLQREVAVKVLRSDVSGEPAFLARFRAEAQHTAALSHPNIAAVYDYGEVPPDDGEHRAYLVMELVAGEPLSAVLEREQRLPVPLALSILRQLASGLAVAHAAGVVHRDVKPGNLLVTADGLVKITDFGIASSASSLPLTRTGQVIGTAHYLAPEQVEGAKAGPVSDVYAAGAVGYECLAGRRAFDGEGAVQIALLRLTQAPAPLPPDVPAPVRALIERAMAKDPAQRFPDGAALRAAVERIIPVVAPSPDDLRTMTATVPLPLPQPPRSPGDTAFLSKPAAGAAAGAAVSAPTTVLPAAAPSVAPRRRRGHRGIAVAVAAVALVLLAAVVYGVLGGHGDPSDPATATTSPPPTSGAAPTTPTPTTPPPVRLAASDYTGRPVAAVQAQLSALGLTVQLKPVQGTRAAAGTVVGIDPTGPVPAGSTVTVSYAAAPTPAPKGDGKGKGGHGKDG